MRILILTRLAGCGPSTNGVCVLQATAGTATAVATSTNVWSTTGVAPRHRGSSVLIRSGHGCAGSVHQVSLRIIK